jgi:hypothetical protein
MSFYLLAKPNLTLHHSVILDQGNHAIDFKTNFEQNFKKGLWQISHVGGMDDLEPLNLFKSCKCKYISKVKKKITTVISLHM